ncbi:MAG: Npun_F5749 family FMN-dependent PPOX-type flavoprotein [Phormidesmis sp.]
MPANLSHSKASLSASATELAPWRSQLARALHRNRAVPFRKFLQLATVRPDSTPSNRTVVFRGFLESSNQLMFISDRRSEKIDQLQQNPNAEACWYFTKTREQFRLSGLLTVVMAESADSAFSQARQQLWQRISDSARLQFAWPQPKAIRTDASDTDASEADDSETSASEFEPPAPDAQTPLPTFCLLLLDPSSVDYLSLRGEPQEREIYQRQGDQWLSDRVNP